MSDTKVVPFKTVRAQALADLARSGLTADDARRMRVEPLTKEETEALIPSKVAKRFFVASYRIPYFGVDGGPVDFARVRLLEEVRYKKADRPLRYWQAPESMPRAYFPPFADWQRIVDDVEVALVVTEGEKKAAAATKAGVPTVGLGGVWSWQSKRLGLALIPDLALVKMVGRSVFLCFDSDADPKPEVAGALEALGHTLESRGAVVAKISLPARPGEKVGLDDYLLKHSADEFRALPHDELSTGAALQALNCEVAMIESPSGIFHVKTGALHAMPTQLAATVYAARTVRKVNGAGQFVDANALIEWTRWPRQTRHSGLEYAPGQPKVLPDNRLNTWRGWGALPRRGDTSNFDRLLDHVFGSSEDARGWFLRWLAYPVQNPGAKLYTACVLWSNEQGSGKSVMGYTVKRVYGDNFVQIGERDLHSQFNSWQAHRQFVLGEEITGSDARREANQLKGIVTGETVRVNDKHQKVYEVRDCANYLFTSNGPDAFLIDAHDRRYFVHEARSTTPPRMRMEESWFTRTYNLWYRSEAGAAAVHERLLRVDCSGFDALARAPMTEAKERMASLSGTDADLVARDLVAAPDRYLRLGDTVVARSLFTIQELYDIVNPGGAGRYTATQLGRALARAGARSTEVTRLPSGPARLVPVRDIERWKTATHAERAAEYLGQAGPKRPAKF